MRSLVGNEVDSVSGGNIIGTICLIAIGAWVWDNRGALDDIAQQASQTASDLQAECGGNG